MNEITNAIKSGLVIPKDKATFKGQQIFEIVKSVPKVKVDKYWIEITKITPIENGIEVLARAWDANGQIGFGKDGSVDLERFRIINPPVLVDDPNGDIVREWTDKKTGEVRIRKLRENIQEALLQSLDHTISVKKEKFGSEKIIDGKAGNTTSTFYPAAGANSPVDGQAQRDIYASTEIWANLRGGAGTGAAVAAASGGMLLISNFDGGTANQWQTMYRVITSFDTSSIPDGDSVSNAVLSYYGQSKTDNFGQSAVIDRRVPASANSLVAADFNAGGWDGTEQASNRITVASWSITGYNDFTLNAAGKGNINKTGLSWFGGRFSGDFDNIEPAWEATKTAMANLYFADQAGTANDPKLVVEHSAPVTAVAQNNLLLMGVA